MLRHKILPRAHSPLDALVVEVGVVLLLERAHDTAQLRELLRLLVAVAEHLVQRSAQLLDAALGQAGQDGRLTGLAGRSDDSAAGPALLFRELGTDVLDLDLRGLDLYAEVGDAVLHLLVQPAGLRDQLLPPLQRGAHALLPRFILLAPLLADLLAPVWAADTAHLAVLVAAVAALLIVAHPVIDVRQRQVPRHMALVLAVESR